MDTERLLNGRLREVSTTGVGHFLTYGAVRQFSALRTFGIAPIRGHASSAIWAARGRARFMGRMNTIPVMS